MQPVHTDVGAYERARLEELARKPRTEVLTVTHDFINEPWAAGRLRAVMESLVERVLAFGPEVDDFRVRKQCLEDAEVLAFQRQHPKLYWMLTDRKMVQEPRVRSALTGLIHVRNKVDCGELQDGQDAEAMATRTVLAALGATHVADAAAAGAAGPAASTD